MSTTVPTPRRPRTLGDASPAHMASLRDGCTAEISHILQRIVASHAPAWETPAQPVRFIVPGRSLDNAYHVRHHNPSDFAAPRPQISHQRPSTQAQMCRALIQRKRASPQRCRYDLQITLIRRIWFCPCIQTASALDIPHSLQRQALTIYIQNTQSHYSALEMHTPPLRALPSSPSRASTKHIGTPHPALARTSNRAAGIHLPNRPRPHLRLRVLRRRPISFSSSSIASTPATCTPPLPPI
ncbi:hypothetical protein DFH09DRAFT_1318066 [Mycena vulgaris]|nr:hypothetical protein DFH09DRAFT_1318066 [Mycena vulgaris]